MRPERFTCRAIILGPILWLCACAGLPSAVPEETSDELVTFAFLPGRAAASETTPLGPITWMRRQARAGVPVLDEGTPIEIVIMTLLEWGLEPRISRSSVVVLEGPSRHNFYADGAEAMIYGFNDGLLVVGPLTEAEMVDVFLAYNLTKADYDLLLDLDRFHPLSATAVNNMAWALATWHDASRRAPSVALDLAIRANEQSGWSESIYLDTLAAAYAANGRFRDAAIHQQWAVTTAAPEDLDGMKERLALFRAEQVYVEAKADAEVLDAALQEKYELALRGDATAQFEFGLYCLRERVGKFGEIEQPGRHFLFLAAQQGEIRAAEEIAYGLLYGEFGLDADPVAARAWLDRAVSAGSGLAAYNLAMMYRKGIGIERDEERVTHWLRVAADRGVAEAAVEVAYRYLEGIGTPSLPAVADELFAKAAAEGVGPLESMYGERDFYFEEVSLEVGEQAPELSIPPRRFPDYLLELVANIERELAQEQSYVTARLPDGRIGWGRDDAPGVIFLFTRTAAGFGSREAQKRLASLYERGYGVEPSADLAAYWRARAARNSGRL